MYVGKTLLVINIPKFRHPDPRSRPQFGQILKLMTGTKGGYLLGWSDEHKWIGGEDAMKLGAPLQCINNLYLDLQQTYHPKV